MQEKNFKNQDTHTHASDMLKFGDFVDPQTFY